MDLALLFVVFMLICWGLVFEFLHYVLLYIVTYYETYLMLPANLLYSKSQVAHAYSLFICINQPPLPYSDTKHFNSLCFFCKNKGYRELM